MSDDTDLSSRQRPQRQRTREIPWDRDSVDGGPSSMTILLNWLTTQGNYSRWDEASWIQSERERVCVEILRLMRSHGITHRHPMGMLGLQSLMSLAGVQG
ncbi:hypothetical protein PGTUg99_005082 [Puccinia graminis f. sp. tritici]|uniref:Uncharacterized protein n=1 Tax=Puccinia graminis f. sp. tritici TaxID=56615 RepID=A0A5B0NF27_PUCGR|nr:hypothetical protein PGTUg99_005082 [Puccinia graminis f. sp. tritici]